MLAVARKRLEAEGLLSRTRLHVGELPTLPPGPPFDGAQMMGCCTTVLITTLKESSKKQP
jgi:hypothetical protein